MSQPRWNPIRLPISPFPSGQLDQQIERAFDELLTVPWLSEAASWMPQLDVFETPDEFVVEADLPGVPVDKLQIRVEDDTVTICGSRSDSHTETTPRGVVRIERRQGAFCRQLTLAQRVDAKAVQVSQDHGVFRIRLPKLSQEDA
ncbi:MAG: Hsp20/alpha crystallin family protein [Planctomycetota bacterium]|jgi:HSP20 family protein